MKICQSIFFAKVGSKFGQMQIINPQNFSESVKFCQIWSHYRKLLMQTSRQSFSSNQQTDKETLMG